MTLIEGIKNHPKVNAFLEMADKNMEAIGFTEHGKRHALLVSNIAFNILLRLGHKDSAQLAAVAGYFHDMGNMISRTSHEYAGALLAQEVLENLKFSEENTALIMSAIGNHEEPAGEPVNEIAAALILADKSDVHRSRVRNPNMIMFDIHDRVNFAAEKSFLRVDSKKKIIALELTIDTKISQVMEYFEIFLSRMTICRKAAKFLGCSFELIINDTKLL